MPDRTRQWLATKRSALIGLYIGIPISLVLWIILLFPAHRTIHHRARALKQEVTKQLRTELRPVPGRAPAQ